MDRQKKAENSPDNEDRFYALWWLIMQTRRSMHKVRARELFRFGITPEEAAVLFVVTRIGDAATPAEISRWILREPHSTSGLLERMHKDGLIDKVRDLHKKNLVRVVITEKGRKAIQQSAERESIYRILSTLSAEERQQLFSLVARLRAAAIGELGTFNVPPFPPV